MKSREEFIGILLSLRSDLKSRFHVESIGIFGSVARNDISEKK